MRQYKKPLRLLVCLSLVLAGFVLSGSVSAATSSTTTAKSTTISTKPNAVNEVVSQSYNADPSVQVGMIVELKAKDPTTVVPLPNTDIQHMLGLVVPTGNATIVLTPATITAQQVLVATSGRYDVLATNQDGPIRVNDYITISALDGVAMKASEQQDEVIGRATSAFTGTSNVLGTVKLKDQAGRTKLVAIGRIGLDLNITHNPLTQKQADYIPSFLNKVATAISNQPVSAARIYLGLVIVVITAFITGTMLYSGVRSGMSAVGRNPLSKKSILRSLIQTVLAAMIIFIVGISAVYLLLKL